MELRLVVKLKRYSQTRPYGILMVPKINIS